MRHEKSKRSILKYTISEIISKIIDNLFDLSPKIEEDPLSIFDTKMEVLVLYANGSLKIFIFLKIPHRITFLTLRQRCRWVITYKSFCAFRDFYFRQESNHFPRKESLFPANVWPKVKRRKLPPRLNDSRWHEQRDWFPSLFATAGSIRTVALWKSIGYIYIYMYTVKICRSTQQIGTPDLWPRPTTINLFTIYRFTPWGKQRAHTHHHNHDV